MVRYRNFPRICNKKVKNGTAEEHVDNTNVIPLAGETVCYVAKLCKQGEEG